MDYHNCSFSNISLLDSVYFTAILLPFGALDNTNPMKCLSWVFLKTSFYKHRTIVVCINHFQIMNQSCEIFSWLVGAAALQEARLKLRENLQTAVRLTVQHECLCPRVSWGGADGWFSSSLWWFMPDTFWYSKRTQQRKKNMGEKYSSHSHVLYFCLRGRRWHFISYPKSSEKG